MTQKQLIAISTGHFYTGTYACNQVKLQMWHFSDFAWIFLTGVAQLQNESNQMTEYLLMMIHFDFELLHNLRGQKQKACITAKTAKTGAHRTGM